MSSMIFAISYFYVNNTYDDFEIEMDKFVQEYYLNKKKTLKKEINTVLDILNYNVKKSNLNDEELKADANLDEDSSTLSLQQSKISFWKSSAITPQEALQSIENDLDRATAVLYKAYQQQLKTYNALSQNELNLYKLFTISKETSDILKDDEFEIDIDYKSKMFEINKLHLTSHEIIHIFINQIKCSLVLLADKISIKVLKSDKEYVTILYTDNGNKINKNIFDLLKKQTSIANINRSTTDVDYFDLILNFNIINSNKRSSIKILESEDIGNTFEIKLPIIKKKFKK